ncbi:hypothetical protein WH87_08250 [Devosia epidermidihirudinis]|uniref:Uncharacterized protein n=1 Tax=Devosia epidermidihirudinis TaxID=1293439 RepID=A0A0F5QDQ4_9HYPH|nr:WcaI family glycosyltransferase [Devosia epidermidihirudinis]KKC38861.1 hypothetical protein WH87_08250 [Devosia epidermidihirudinis]
MKILIVGLNYAPEQVGTGIYTTGMAEALAARGHQVRVIAGQPYFPAWRVFDGHSRVWFGRELRSGVAVIRVPHYVPQKPTGIRRVLHHLSFAVGAIVPTFAMALSEKPDVILTIAPSLSSAPLALFAAKLCGAKTWLHVQDFEVEAAVATGLLKDGTWANRLAKTLERRLVAAFDRVSTISPQMSGRLRSLGVPHRRIVKFRNWADLGAITPMKAPSPLRAEWGISTRHVALYSGSIGHKQGIEAIIQAARRLQNRIDLTFVVCGDGPTLPALRRQAAGLGNVQFRPLQPHERLNDVLGLARVHLLPQRASAADLMLPSKLSNMLASGRPIVATAHPGTGLAEEVHGCGLLVPPGDDIALAAAVETLLDDTPLRARLGEAARSRAELRWNGETILDGFAKRLEALAAPSPHGAPIRHLKGAP